jgi:hypothetical protein
MPGFNNAERLALYTHLRTFESDFDKSQSQMRAICSAWSGVVLGAIALLVTSAYTPPVGMGVADANLRAETFAALRTVVCIIGSAGVYAFWFIDQRIYQRLLHSVFAYGLFVEFKNPDLPQIRSAMYIANLDITSGLAWFYRTQFWLFFAISLFFVAAVGKTTTFPEMALLGVHFIGNIVGEACCQGWSTLRELISAVFRNGGLAGAMPERSDEQTERLTNWLARVGAHPIPEKPETQTRETQARETQAQETPVEPEPTQPQPDQPQGNNP